MEWSESTTERGSFQGELLQRLMRAAVRQYSKAFFVYAKTVNRLLGSLPETCPNKNHSYMPGHAGLKHPSCTSELQKGKMK